MRDGDPKLRAGICQPGRGADQRIHRRVARQPAAHRRGNGFDQRAAHLRFAGQSVRHVGLGGRAARDVERHRERRRRSKRALRDRIDSGLRHIAFFIVPSAAAFLAFGDLIAGALLQTGRFTHTDAQYVWGILAGSSVGLLASTMGRLYSSAYYALRDTRTPLQFAVLRVALTTVLGYLCAKPLPVVDRDRSALGRRGIDGVSRNRRMGGVRAVAARAASQAGTPAFRFPDSSRSFGSRRRWRLPLAARAD